MFSTLKEYESLEHFVRFQSIFAFVGDSPIPLLGLVETVDFESANLFFSPEKSEKMSCLKSYLSEKYQNRSFHFHELPSMNNTPSQVKAIADIFESPDSYDNSESAVFVSAGTSTMVLTMLYHARCRYSITIRKKLEFVISDANSSNEKISLHLDGEKLDLNGILHSCGWIYDTKEKVLKSENLHLSEKIDASYSSEVGELSFMCVVSKTPKHGEKIVSFMSSLRKEFGVNGANYIVKGPLTRREKNLLPVGIRHVK